MIDKILFWTFQTRLIFKENRTSETINNVLYLVNNFNEVSWEHQQDKDWRLAPWRYNWLTLFQVSFKAIIFFYLNWHYSSSSWVPIEWKLFFTVNCFWPRKFLRSEPERKRFLQHSLKVPCGKIVKRNHFAWLEEQKKIAGCNIFILRETKKNYPTYEWSTVSGSESPFVKKNHSIYTFELLEKHLH